MTGKRLQTNIIEIVTQYRRHHIKVGSDIKQMYQQMILHPVDRNLHVILYRSTADQSIESFQLNTATYGFNFTPYFAIRTLH